MIDSHKIIVLKFGHSILKSEADIPQVIAETYLYLRQQYKILVVVSALGNTTNELSEQIKNIFPDGMSDAPVESLANLLGSGEIISSNLVTIGFNQAGIHAYNLTHEVIKTNGDILDAVPIWLDTNKINQLFNSYDVLVLPGFIGVNENKQTTLLGRGGSDFSAIFIAQNLATGSCILYKDSSGIVDDINLSLEEQRVYSQVSYNHCLRISNQVIQHKALEYARDHKQTLIVKNIYSSNQSVINGLEEFTFNSRQELKKTKIVLLGLGTVGLGVFHKLLKNNRFFEIVGIGVKNLDKHQHHGIDNEILSNDVNEILSRDYDVLIELVGGIQAKDFIINALQNKKHVVTANKLVIAEFFDELHSIAIENNVSLKYSAAVAGVVPVLEMITNLRKKNVTITEISGILNGTSNFILNNVDKGVLLKDAIKIAQDKGYAESDPTLDINGMDALHKIKIISFLAFSQKPDKILVEGLEQLENFPENKALVTKLIATSKIIEGKLIVQVQLGQLDPKNILAAVTDANNCVIIKTNDNKELILQGRGAGRWPTAIAVYADILDLSLGTTNYA